MPRGPSGNCACATEYLRMYPWIALHSLVVTLEVDVHVHERPLDDFERSVMSHEYQDQAPEQTAVDR